MLTELKERIDYHLDDIHSGTIILKRFEKLESVLKELLTLLKREYDHDYDCGLNMLIEIEKILQKLSSKSSTESENFIF